MAFVRRLAVVSTLLLTVLSALLMYGTRALFSSYACLHLAELATLVDVHTRYSVTTWDSLTEEIPSPNGRFIAYQTTLADSGRNRLSVRPVDGERELFLHENIVRFLWSADSRYMAYMWRDGDGLGQFWGTIANADGSDARSTVLGSTVTDFYGLSADNQYVAFTTENSFGSALNFLSVPDFQLSSMYTRGQYPFRVEWSPQGHHLVYPSYNQEFGGISFTWVSVVSPEAGEVTLPLPAYPNHLESSWSPDRKTVGIHYAVETVRPGGRAWRTRLDLIGTDGTLIPDVAVAVEGINMPVPPVIWSADSHSLVAWNGQANGSLSLERFYLADGQYETIIANVPYLLPYSPDQRRMAVAVVSADDGINLMLMDADGENQMTLIEDTYSTTSDPSYAVYWSPHGEALAAVQNNGFRYLADTQVAWALSDGTQANFLSDQGFVTSIIWLDEAFVYAVEKEQGRNAVLVNLYSGTHQILANELTTLDSMEENSATGGITFRWQTADGQAGFDTYAPDGEQIHHFILAGSAIPIDDTGFPRSLYWSPNGNKALLIFDANGSRGLQLASTDGESQVIRPKLPWVYTPYWSPDDHMLAFIAVNLPGIATLDVVTADGENVAQFEQFPTLVNAPQMHWTRCEPRLR
jgi:hypothetical protein